MNFVSKGKSIMVIGAAILTILIAMVYQLFASNQDILEQIKQGESETANIESLGGGYPSYKLWDTNDNLLGYAVITSSSGYGGKIRVLTVIEESGQIKSVGLLENHETPTYLNKVLNSGIFRTITSQNIKDNLAGVDDVSGATITTEAILASVQKGSAQIGNQQLGLEIPDRETMNLNWKDLTALGLLLAALLGSALNIRKWRPWLLALSVLFIGFLCNYSLTVGSYIGLLSGQLPVFSERPIWYVMVPGILVITLVWGRNFYCSWICPFGAVQEGLYHSLNLFQFSPSSAIKSRIARFRWPLAWLAAILAFIFNNGQIAAYEPFAVFFSASGNTAQWIMMIVIVLASIAQMRFWCGSFCPVGLILQLLACARRKARRLLGQKRTKKEEQEIVSSCQVCSNPDCPTPARIAQERYSIQDKIFIGTAIIVNLLIIGTLLQNILFVLQNEALNTFFWSQEFIQMK